MLDLPGLFQRFRIPVIGVIHVGAYIGTEDSTYRVMGFTNRLFIEAQPDTYEVLRTNLAGLGALCEQVAISDRVGTSKFHIVNFAQSSSLLELARHKDVAPDIHAVSTIDVATTTLDALLARPDYRHLRFNFLNMDIQGAEMLALRGATESLRVLDALSLEINFDELYAGAPHVSELDAFLRERGFTRTDSVSSHNSWGDGFWVRDHLTKVA